MTFNALNIQRSLAALPQGITVVQVKIGVSTYVWLNVHGASASVRIMPFVIWGERGHTELLLADHPRAAKARWQRQSDPPGARTKIVAHPATPADLAAVIGDVAERALLG